MKRELNRSISQLKDRLVVWCVLAVVLEIVSVFAPLPFVQVMAWLAVGYSICLLVILIVLLVMKHRQTK